MRAAIRLVFAAAIAAAFFCTPRTAGAQAFTPPAQVGSVTLAWQWVDNTGHFLTDGFLLKAGPSVTSSALVEVDYGITERFAATASLPYVFAKYTGALPPISQLEIDSCKCWHSAFQDFSIGGRYRLGDEIWAVTPSVRYSVPSHHYGFAGEAVVGKRLQEFQLGINSAVRLVDILPKASAQAGYTYSIVESPLDDVSINRSNGFFDLGYSLTRSFYVHGTAIWQFTHGGLNFGSITGQPFRPPGELNTPERYAQRDRVIQTRYWHAGGGFSYSTGPFDIFASVEKYVKGWDAHNGIAYTVGSTWNFSFSKPTP